MNVQSLAFLAFLTVTVCVCRLLPKERTWVLLAASLVFYLWGGAPAALWGCGLLAVSSFVSYLAANTLRKHRRKASFLPSSAITSRYWGFSSTPFFHRRRGTDALRALGYQLFHLPADLVSSGGLCRDLFTGPHSGRIPDLQLLFPTVSSGPILKPENFFPQLREASPLPQDTAAGLYAIGLGLAKRCCWRTIWACW